jgi:integrase
MRRLAADGTEHLPSAHVFGNEVGERVPDIRRDWASTCQAAGIAGLHFHDLRREFGSRLLETPGVGPHHVRDCLGHANITTTSTYLATTIAALQHVGRQFEQHRQIRTAFAQLPAHATIEASAGTPGIADKPLN